MKIAHMLTAVGIAIASLGVTVEIDDRRNRGAALDVSFNGVLRPDQGAAVEALRPHDIGVLAATTAFGKTVVAARMIADRVAATRSWWPRSPATRLYRAPAPKR